MNKPDISLEFSHRYALITAATMLSNSIPNSQYAHVGWLINDCETLAQEIGQKLYLGDKDYQVRGAA